jgi:DNA mismatch repair ATPase MutS
LVHYSELEKVCTAEHLSEKLTLLLNLLDTATFKGKPSALSRIGIILAAYKLMQEVGNELQPALHALGEIDAYVSCAHVLNCDHYSFAQYDTISPTPFLHAQNFWHPLVASDSIELNSISLGLHNNMRNIIITGPNACGKSTNLKALALCAYLAQTITIVPAEQCNQTVYKEIYSAIVVSDKIQENKSLFVAELIDAEELLMRAENLGAGEYMIIVLDELFKSTHHEKGQQVAVQLLEHLYALPNVITIVSTHFEKLIELADQNHAICANYTVDDFKLKPGIGSRDNTFDIVSKKTRSRLLE